MSSGCCRSTNRLNLRCFLFRKIDGQQSRGLSLACVLGYLMCRADRLVENLADMVGSLLRRYTIAENLRDDSPFQYVGEKKTPVLMRLANSARRIVHLTHGNLPAIKVDVWKVMFEEGRARPTACSRSRLGLCSESSDRTTMAVLTRGSSATPGKSGIANRRKP